MATIQFSGRVAASVASQAIHSLDTRNRLISGPKYAYPGQDLSPLFALVPHLRDNLPSIALRVGLVENATVVVHPGYDGVVLDSKLRLITETSFYSNFWRENRRSAYVELDIPEVELEDLFVAFDGAWFVYYHWLCFALGPAALAQGLLEPAIPIGIPAYTDRAEMHPVAFSKEVYDRSLSLFTQPERVRVLDRGIYRVKRAYILYVDGSQNTDMTFHPAFRRQFEAIGAQLAKPKRRNRRTFASRALRGTHSRITTEEDDQIAELATQWGFDKVYLEKLSFDDQIRAFAEAEIILAPHGSGLANLLFAPKGARVIELSRDIDGNSALRPWFYAIAAGGELSYATLNGDAGDLSSARLEQCFQSLSIDRPPPPSIFSPRHWWNFLQRLR